MCELGRMKNDINAYPQVSLQNYPNQLNRSRAVLLDKAHNDRSTDADSFQINPWGKQVELYKSTKTI